MAVIVVSPLHEVQAAVQRWRPSHLISMGSPGAETAAAPDGVAVLRLSFHDIATPRPGLTLASAEQVAAVIAFAQGVSADRAILVHCWAGVSRSPAAAYVIACARAKPGAEVELAQALRKAAPFATPNPRLVALGDRLLGRDGRMIAAISAIGRGAETGTGRQFRFPPPPA